jgi:hypothetical protein
VTTPEPNFTRLDPNRPNVAILLEARLRARKVVAARLWTSSQEATSEDWGLEASPDSGKPYLLGISGWICMNRMDVFVEQCSFEVPDLGRPKVFGKGVVNPIT